MHADQKHASKSSHKVILNITYITLHYIRALMMTLTCDYKSQRHFHRTIHDGHVRIILCDLASLLIQRIRLPRSSYYDKHYRQSAALIRARQPFLIRNIATGVGLCAFTVAVCMCLPFELSSSRSMKPIEYTNFSTDSWTINAVAQDDFSDVPIPDAPPQAAHTPHTGVEKSASGDMLEQRREDTRARSL